MAGVTERACIVVRGRDLREITRLGGVLLVAADAERGDIGERRLGGDRVAAVGMRRLRPVTRFAGHVSVFTRGSRLGLIGVTQDALRLAGEDHGPRSDQIQGRGPVVAVPAKALGNHRLANQ